MTLSDLSFTRDDEQTPAIYEQGNLAQSHITTSSSLLVFHLLQRGNIQLNNQLIDVLESFGLPTGMKDVNGNFIYANRPYLELANLPSHYLYEGKDDSELPTPFSGFAESFKQQDSIVINENRALKILDIHSYGSFAKTKPFIFYKYPLYDINWKIIGTFFIGLDPLPTISTCHQVARITLNSNKQTAAFGFCKTPVEILNKREWEVVYLLANGITRKEISAKLKISNSTVNSYLQSAVKSTHTGTVHQLVESVKDLGWLSDVPESLLTPASIII